MFVDLKCASPYSSCSVGALKELLVEFWLSLGLLELGANLLNLHATSHVGWRAHFCLESPPPTDVERSLPDEHTKDATTHHHSVHERQRLHGLGSSTLHFDSEQTALQSVDEYHEHISTPGWGLLASVCSRQQLA